jgi:hypothetical protein
MVCPRCRRDIPDESSFCLGCGTRVAPAERVTPVNGEGHTVPVPMPVAAAPAAPPGGNGQKEAYTLAFGVIVDERLRYRVARWVCQQAPAHPLNEVQAGLRRGDFFTFLALTRNEAEAARRGIEGLGLAPALVRLAPATAADMLRPGGGATGRAEDGPLGLGRSKDWLVVLLAIVALFGAGLVLVRMFGRQLF